MPMRFYRLRDMPDGEERVVPRREYRWVVLTDSILPGRWCRAKASALFRWLKGEDVASMFIGNLKSGRIIEVPTAAEVKEMGIPELADKMGWMEEHMHHFGGELV